MNKPSKGCHAKLISYAKKTFKVNDDDHHLRSAAKGKSYSPQLVLKSILSGFLMGKRSARELVKHHDDVKHRLGYGNAESRMTIGNLLNEHRVAEFLKTKLLKTLTIASSLRAIGTFPATGKIVALMDGIDLGEAHKNGTHCEFCLPRRHHNEIRYFHRIVVVSIVTKYGAMPIYFRFCRMNEIPANPEQISLEALKQEGELSCAKEILVEIAGYFKGRLPFDIIASDSLMANAPFLELVESLGSAGIFVFNQENRLLYQQAQSDFRGKTFAFDVNKLHWKEDPSRRGRIFESQWSRYRDVNRKGENKNVLIFETVRTETSGNTSSSMAITSDRKFITPQLVEIARYEKWSNLENGVFNELTNNWNILKHIFFHKSNSMRSIIALQFLALIISTFYRYGNLTRGSRRFTGTLRDFFAQMNATFNNMKNKTLKISYYNST